MAYCTDLQIQELLEGIENLRLPSESSMTNRSTQAQAWVDGYLDGLGYTVPFTTVPQIIQVLTATRAAYLILRSVNVGGQFTDAVDELKQDADRMMKDIVDGRISLVTAERADDPDDEDVVHGVAVSNPHGRPRFRYGETGRRL
jgi:phage gp36-like protein